MRSNLQLVSVQVTIDLGRLNRAIAPDEHRVALLRTMGQRIAAHEEGKAFVVPEWTMGELQVGYYTTLSEAGRSWLVHDFVDALRDEYDVRSFVMRSK